MAKPSMARLDAKEAGYMELKGAQKDADCRKVEVRSGVSSELGCCNEFHPRTSGVQAFKCGTCEYVQIGKRNYLFGGT